MSLGIAEPVGERNIFCPQMSRRDVMWRWNKLARSLVMMYHQAASSVRKGDNRNTWYACKMGRISRAFTGLTGQGRT